METPLIDKWSILAAAAALLISWLLFWNDSGKPMISLAAAAISSALVFLAYIVFRMVFLAWRR